MRTPILAAALVLAACGGGAPPAETPSVNADASAVSAPAVDAGPTTTTTATLPDGGDLQGTKLVTKTQTVIENPAADAGASLGPSKEQGRSKEDVTVIIQAHRAEARACYDAALKTHPDLKGKLDVTWTVDPKGNVTEAGLDAAKSDIHEQSVVSCVQSVVRGIKFAPSEKGLESHMHYPFDFNPHGTNKLPAPG